MEVSKFISRILLLLVLPLGYFGVGCSDDSSRPVGEPHIVLSVDISEQSSGDERLLKVIANVRHLGGPSVSYSTSCGSISVSFEVLDANGEHVALVDPCGPRPMCPSYLMELKRGNVISQELLVNGRIWDEECVEGTLSPGRYTVLVIFPYSIDSDPWILEEKTTFDW